MTSNIHANTLAQTLRQAHPERYLSTLLAPKSKRQALLTVYALDLELAKIPVETSTPFTAAIRLQWFKDHLTGENVQKRQDIALFRLLDDVLSEWPALRPYLVTMVEKAVLDIEPDSPAALADADEHWQQTLGPMLRAAALVLAPTSTVDDIPGHTASVLGWSHLLLNLDRHLDARGQGRLMLPTSLQLNSTLLSGDASHDDKLRASQSLVRTLRQHAEAHIPDALQDLQQQQEWRPLRLQLIAARSALGVLKKADDHLHQMDNGRFRARLPLTMISAWIRRC